MVDCRRSSFGYNWENVNELSSDGELAVCSGIVFIGVWLVGGKAEFFGSDGIEVFLGVFVAVGILCGQELMYWRTELGSGIWRVRLVEIGERGGLFRILEVSCTLVWVVSDSSPESLVGELVSKNGKFCEVDCGWVVMIFCGWVVFTDFEVLVYYLASLLLYQETMEQMGYGLRMRNPVCLYLNLDKQYIQVVIGMNGLN